MPNENDIGYLKYHGKLIDEGVMDAKVAATALEGFDNALRFFIVQQRPDLSEAALPIPVRIEKGSLGFHIPDSVVQWIVAGAGIAVTGYLATAAKKMAEKDFNDIGLKTIFKNALKGLQWLIRLGRHLGHLNVRHLTGVKWDQDCNAAVPNEAGEYLYVPIDELKRITQCPPSLLSGIASAVEIERTLIVGVSENGKFEEVTVTRRERHIFYTSEDEDNDILFPELAHGMPVELRGIVTRANEMANTIGFWYNNHILTCNPRTGSIVRFKKHLFLLCKISGRITRFDKDGKPIAPRPKIEFDDLEILSDDDQMGLQLGDADDE